MKIFLFGAPNIGPYHYARFAAVSKAEPDFAYVKVPSKDAYRPWAGDNPVAGFELLTILDGDSVWSFLSNKRPDVVVTVGYANSFTMLAALWARAHSVPLIAIIESTNADKPRQWWKEFAKKMLVSSLYDSAFVTGSRAADYAGSLGLNRSDTVFKAGVVDNSHFSKPGAAPVGFPKLPQKFFLCVARLSPEKNIHRLILAFLKYRKDGGDWGLVISGAGPQEQELREGVPQEVKGHIYWVGWTGYNALPWLYNKAGCLVLPSISEPWGLVVNEAMAAGLPVVVSNKCGSVVELCQESRNGYIVDPFNIEDIAAKLKTIASDRVDLAKMGQISRDIIAEYTPEQWAASLLEVSYKLSGKRRLP